MLDKLRYPIGPFVLPESGDAAARLRYVTSIGAFPERFREAARELKTRDLLEETYRPGGWTARQVIHHVADSHVNAYVRHRRTLTEEHPTIMPYAEQHWAELADVTAVPIETSLALLDSLHLRWATLLATLSPVAWARTAHHPGSKTDYTLEQLAANYAWHGAHHLAHLRIILDRNA